MTKKNERRDKRQDYNCKKGYGKKNLQKFEMYRKRRDHTQDERIA